MPHYSVNNLTVDNVLGYIKNKEVSIPEIIGRTKVFEASRTMAFGDGGNDTSMILQAGIGVAMGNAIDALK